MSSFLYVSFYMCSSLPLCISVRPSLYLCILFSYNHFYIFFLSSPIGRSGIGSRVSVPLLVCLLVFPLAYFCFRNSKGFLSYFSPVFVFPGRLSLGLGRLRLAMLNFFRRHSFLPSPYSANGLDSLSAHLSPALYFHTWP